MPHSRDRRKLTQRQDAIEAAPEPTAQQPELAEVIRFKITATDSKFGELLRLLNSLHVVGSQRNIRTGFTINIVANRAFFEALRDLKKLGTFQGKLPAQPRRA